MVRTLLFIVRNVLLQRSTYRMNLLYSVAQSVFYLLIQIAIWVALYAGQGEVAGTTLDEMITYVVLAQLIGIFSGVYLSGDLEGRVKSGDIAVDLLKPLDLRLLLIFENIGWATYSFLVRGIPMLAVALLFFTVNPPASAIHLAYFVVSLFGAWLVSAMIEFVKSTVVFWSMRPNTFGWVFEGLGSAFGGGIVPLWFFPPALMAFAQALPFHLIRYVPAAIYLGKIDVADLPLLIVRQFAWAAGLGLLQTILWKRGIRRITVYGG